MQELLFLHFQLKPITTGTNPFSVSVGDLNGDGKQDMAVTNHGSGNVSVFLNTTAPGSAVPSFSLKSDFSTGTSPMFVAIRDMNGDGKPDLIVTNSGSNNVSLLLNNMDLTLPVELTSFSSLVKDPSVVLYWNTATELNSHKFEIERSIVSLKCGTSTWVSIGIVPASGTTSSPKKYSYTDNNLQTGKYQYRLKMVDDNGTFKYSSIIEAVIGIPKDFNLSQNYPNPFNPSTKIEYTLPESGLVKLQIFSVTGQLVKLLVNQNQEAGYYSIDFNGTNLSSGLYIYRLSVNNKNIVRKMMLLK
jgi:hypothetical protein